MAAVSHMEFDGSMLWERLEQHQLFNKLNNGEPLILLDMRDSQSHESCRIRNSFHVTDINSLHCVLDESLKPRGGVLTTENRGTTNFVLLFPTALSVDIQTSHYTNLHEYITNRNGKFVVGVENLENREEMSFLAHVFFVPNIQDFFERYHPCTLLLEHGAQRTAYCSKYYASEVLPGFLYLGDYCNATDEHQLKALRITHVLDATNTFMSEAICTRLGLIYLPIEVWDVETADIKQHFALSNAFIRNAQEKNPNAKVLVHCRAGWSRSPSLVLAYMLAHCSLGLVEAAQRVVRERPMVCPNEGFRTQLIDFEREVSTGPPHTRCSSPDELREKILQVSCLWSQAGTVETNFDRIPILAYKQHNKLPVVDDVQGNLAENGNAAAAAKPKKAFLRRGEGRKMLPTPKMNKGEQERESKIYAEMGGDN
ncbi:dual specificity protein phosphatase family protein [archaeon]|nr:MAG: dual specificity protein phosphatase family protein [archaeon]